MIEDHTLFFFNIFEISCATYNQFVCKLQPTMNSHTYKLKLVKCFNLVFGTSHSSFYNFSNEEFFNLTPDKIYAYLANKAFGTTQPLDTDKSTQDRSNSIEYAKKAISYFMPKN